MDYATKIMDFFFFCVYILDLKKWVYAAYRIILLAIWNSTLWKTNQSKLLSIQNIKILNFIRSIYAEIWEICYFIKIHEKANHVIYRINF